MKLRLHLSPLIIAIAAALGFLPRSAQAVSDDIPISDFKGPTYGEWKATGTAFLKGPATGDLIQKLEIENAGSPAVASSEIEGDAPTGTLTSQGFRINRAYISFLIAGGRYEHHTCINLLIDGKIVRSATGWNSDHLVPVSWDVRRWDGRRAQIQIVDEASGNWGHINVDQILQTDRPPRLPVATEPLYRESLRPQFHFTARQWTIDRLNPGMREEGWLNDLNGLIYHAGEYHLFSQRWNKCWIHAVSKDLVHWTELEPAFWEEHLDTGVQSGTCVVDRDNTSGLGKDSRHPPLVAFWSRNDNRSHCLSYSLDQGRTWTHYSKNPILVFPERDPKVFWHAPSSRWIMFLYGEQDRQRLYHIFTSTNLLTWHDEKRPIKDSFECPDFFQLPLDGDRAHMKWVLVRGNGKYSIGEFTGTEFKEETTQFDSDAGPNFYATQSWENAPAGRRVQVAWMQGGSYPDMPFNQQVTFPRELTLRTTPAGPRLYRQPIREIASLHRTTDTWKPRTLRKDQSLPLSPSGQLFHLQCEVDIPAGARLTFNIRGIPVILTSKTLESGHPPTSVQQTVGRVEILIDRTSIETFVNDGEITASRCVLPKANGLSVKAEGGPIAIGSLAIHTLDSAWPPQPTR